MINAKSRRKSRHAISKKGLLALHFLEEPCLGKRPQAVGRPRRDVHEFGDLADRQPREVAKLHQSAACLSLSASLVKASSRATRSSRGSGEASSLSATSKRPRSPPRLRLAFCRARS